MTDSSLTIAFIEFRGQNDWAALHTDAATPVPFLQVVKKSIHPSMQMGKVSEAVAGSDSSQRGKL